MDDRRLGQAVRAQRHRKSWRLADLAAVADLSVTTCSELERGHAAEMTVHAVRAIADAVGLPLGWDLGWKRQEIDRLLDHDHALMAARVTRWLERQGWRVRPEVSFNQYGDRGRIDLLAYEPRAAVLLVIELKTVIVDAQDLLGGMDVKTRVAPGVAREIGWQAGTVVPALIVRSGTTNRRRLADLGPLLGRYAMRGPAALAWLRRPIGAPAGLLLLTTLPESARSDARRAGRARVRRRTADSRSGRSSSKGAPPLGRA